MVLAADSRLFPALFNSESRFWAIANSQSQRLLVPCFWRGLLFKPSTAVEWLPRPSDLEGGLRRLLARAVPVEVFFRCRAFRYMIKILPICCTVWAPLFEHISSRILSRCVRSAPKTLILMSSWLSNARSISDRTVADRPFSLIITTG